MGTSTEPEVTEKLGPEFMRPQAKAEVVHIPAPQIIKPFDFTQEQIELIKRMHQASGLTNDEFTAFMHFCRKKRVDPILKQAYAMKRKSKSGDMVMVVMTSIEGLRAIADRTREYCPSDEPEFIGEGSKLVSKVAVKKYVQGEWHEFKGVAYFSEFNQGGFMWEKMPRNQLAKCAEAQALRKGWPEDCGGFYVPEEFPEITVNGEEVKPSKEKGKLGKLKKSETDNRGHGNEGIKEAVNPEPKETKVLAGNVDLAFFHDSNGKQWVDVKFYINATTSPINLNCWHKSLHHVLLTKPKKVELLVKGYGGHKGQPTIEDILSVNGIKYEKGVPKTEEKGDVAAEKEPLNNTGGTSGEVVPPASKALERRNESLLELSQLLEALWPAKDIGLRSIRNKVGQSMFALENKAQLMDLAYPQIKIDAAIVTLKRYINKTEKPTSESGIENELFNMFNSAVEEIKGDNF